MLWEGKESMQRGMKECRMRLTLQWRAMEQAQLLNFLRNALSWLVPARVPLSVHRSWETQLFLELQAPNWT